MENNYSESGLRPVSNPETQPEIRLSPKVVEGLYNSVKRRDNDFGRPKYVHMINCDYPFVFDETRLTENSEKIIQFAHQLQPRFFNTNGHDYSDAVNDKYQTRWDDSEGGVFAIQLLSMIKAIGYGDFATTKILSKYFNKEPVKFSINPEKYQLIYKDKPGIHVIK